MPIDYARTAGAMSDLVSQPVNSFMAARDYAQQNQRRNMLADQVAQRTDMEWQQQQQDRQNKMMQDQQAQQDAQHQKETEAIYMAAQAGDPQAQALALQKAVEAAPPEIAARLQQMDPAEAWSKMAPIIAKKHGFDVGSASTGGGFGNVNPGDYTPESLARYAQTKNYADLQRQYAPLAPAQPILINTPAFGAGLVDRRTGQPIAQFTTPEQESAARATASQQVATASAAGRAQGAAQAQLPTAVGNADNMLDVLGQLDKAKGLRHITGMFSVAPVVPGTDQADAYALWEQVQGKAFLQAFDTLKGGGQITEVEGKKATAAITRIANRGQSLGAFKQSISELKNIVNNAKKRAAEKAGQAPAASAAPVDPLGIR